MCGLCLLFVPHLLRMSKKEVDRDDGLIKHGRGRKTWTMENGVEIE